MKYLAPLLAFLLAACTSYEFVDQDILLLHDAETDELSLVLIHEALRENTGDSQKEIAKDAEGARHIILIGWPWEFDMADLEQELADDEEDSLAPRLLEFVRGFRVVDSGLFLRDDSELCLYQHVSFQNASAGLELMDEAINRTLLEEEADGLEDWNWDAGSKELWIERARSGGRWAFFEDGGLVVSLPMTPRGAASLLGKLINETSTEIGELTSALTSLTIEQDLCTLRFEPGEDGWIRFHVHHEGNAEEKRIEVDEEAGIPSEPASVFIRALRR
jgi:hypothetical protein